MNKEKIILLAILEIVLFIFVLQIIYSPMTLTIEDLNNKLTLNKKMIDSLEENLINKDALWEERKEEVYQRVSHYESEENLFLFGQDIKDQLLAQGLTISRYQQISSAEGEEFQYSLEGTTYKLLNFLILLSKSEFYIRVSQLTVDTQRTPNRMTLKLASARLPEEILLPPPLSGDSLPLTTKTFSHSPSQISRIFPYTYTYTAPKEQIIEVSVPPSQAPRRNIDFIGSVKTVEAGTKYSFKDKSSDELIIINESGETNYQGWSLKEVTINAFILYNDGYEYEVKR